jgi:uncharacterized protein YbjQ (UPF0145 family)
MMEYLEPAINLGLPLLLLIIGFVVGRAAEKKHYRSIIERERKYAVLPATSLKRVAFPAPVAEAFLVTGSAVISVDYFKRFIAALRNLIGGRVTSYESLIDRARREAVLRMKAAAGNADMILNARLETATIGGGNAGGRGAMVSVEVFAYGTAVRLTR